MNKFTVVVIAGFLFLTTACVSSVTSDIEVSTESDPKVNISGFKSYSWLGSAKLLYDPEGKWEPRQMDMDAEIKLLIDMELKKRGIIQTNDYPDMIVGFAAGVDMKALGFVKDKKTKLEIIQEVPKGALVVVFVDAKTGYPIWAGAAEANVQEQPSNEVVQKRLEYAVKKMFKKLPK